MTSCQCKGSQKRIRPFYPFLFDRWIFTGYINRQISPIFAMLKIFRLTKTALFQNLTTIYDENRVFYRFTTFYDLTRIIAKT